uniref:Centromere protein X n=1 Tax=Molossus molossus TaxID=27622 RepID=A0A7J8CWM3_MOLMO|nr:centromere protein X [Molossus molossus]
MGSGHLQPHKEGRTGEQTAAPAFQGRQDQSQRGRTAARGGAAEGLRRGSSHPQCQAGPGGGPGLCGCGPTGEGAAAAASGLLGVSPLTEATCPTHNPAPCPRVFRGLRLQTGKGLLIPRRPSTPNLGQVPANALLSPLPSSALLMAWTKLLNRCVGSQARGRQKRGPVLPLTSKLWVTS